jgi:hypothetical protein
MGPPLWREERSDCCWSPPLYWGVTLLAPTLIHSLALTPLFSAGQYIPCLLWGLKFHYRFHKSPPLDSILNHLVPLHSFTPCSCEINCNINLHISIVTLGLKARIVEPEEADVARERLCKHASAATYARNNRITVGGDVFYAVRAEVNVNRN